MVAGLTVMAAAGCHSREARVATEGGRAHFGERIAGGDGIAAVSSAGHVRIYERQGEEWQSAADVSFDEVDTRMGPGHPGNAVPLAAVCGERVVVGTPAAGQVHLISRRGSEWRQEATLVLASSVELPTNAILTELRCDEESIYAVYGDRPIVYRHVAGGWQNLPLPSAFYLVSGLVGFESWTVASSATRLDFFRLDDSGFTLRDSLFGLDVAGVYALSEHGAVFGVRDGNGVLLNVIANAGDSWGLFESLGYVAGLDELVASGDHIVAIEDIGCSLGLDVCSGGLRNLRHWAFDGEHWREQEDSLVGRISDEYRGGRLVRRILDIAISDGVLFYSLVLEDGRTEVRELLL